MIALNPLRRGQYILSWKQVHERKKKFPLILKVTCVESKVFLFFGSFYPPSRLLIFRFISKCNKPFEIYLIRTNFCADLISRTAISSDLNRPKYFKERFWSECHQYFEIVLKRNTLDIAYLYCLKEFKQKTTIIF